MLQKWTTILFNWINCYFHESDINDKLITFDTLVDILAHLRNNINLDESKSSIFEAHTLQDFIAEKYPTFTFENGTTEPVTEDDKFTAASLLLFFVCVNSKDVDIKSAMCSKLSKEDQEIILKFSTTLMECPAISYKEVYKAISDACVQDLSFKNSKVVAETPPPLRSLHCELRRLQAALDAEKFDNNYLQDELARTNMKVDKLLKVKELYKQDIVNLKAKLNQFSAQSDMLSSAETEANSTKLGKQIQQLEDKLLTAQENLDDIQYERDIYKAKVDELKLERDKWLNMNQQETFRSNQLLEELANEKQQNCSLKEMVNELLQHKQKNCIDSSLLECDDSNTSFNHNTSVCSEACTHVVEIQLGEEKAKVASQQEQMQALEIQIKEINEKYDTDIKTLQDDIKTKDECILNLKEIEKDLLESKNQAEINFTDIINKLNNELTEMDRKIININYNSRTTIEEKNFDIQTLQEEKILLLQSLSDKTSSLETVIDDLKTSLDKEKVSNLKIKEEFENHMMKLNEKVLNRNNELVELQNKIFEKSEYIEQLQIMLKKEKELKDDLSNKHNHELFALNDQKSKLDRSLEEKSKEISSLQAKIFENSEYIEQLQIMLKKEKELKDDLSNKHNHELIALNDQKVKLDRSLEEKSEEISSLQAHVHRDSDLIKQLKEEINDQKLKLDRSLEEKCEEISSLQAKIFENSEYIEQLQIMLKKEKELKDDLSNKHNLELFALNEQKVKLDRSLEEKSEEISSLQAKIFENSEYIEQLQIMLKKEKELKDDLSNKHNLELFALNDQKVKLDRSLEEKSEEISSLQAKIFENSEYIEQLQIMLKKEKELKDDLSNKHNHELFALNDQKVKLDRSLEEKSEEISSLQAKIFESSEYIEQLQIMLKKEKELKDDLSNKHNHEFNALNDQKVKLDRSLEEKSEEISSLQAKIFENSEYIEQLQIMLKKEKELKDDLSNKHNHELFALNDQKGKLDRSLEEKSEEISSLQAHIHRDSDLIKQLKEEIYEQKVIVTQQKDLYKELNETNGKLLQEVTSQQEQMQALEIQIKEISEKYDTDIKTLQDDIKTKDECILNLKEIEKDLLESKNQAEINFTDIINKLNNELTEMDRKIININYNSRTTIEEKIFDIQTLQEEKILLLQSLSDKTSSLETVIDDLKTSLDKEKVSKQKIKEEFENHMMKLNEKVLNRNNELVELQNKIFEKSEYIEQLQIMLKKEKELKDDLSNKHNHELFALNDQKVKLDRSLEEKSEEISSLQAKIFENSEYIEQLQIMLKKEKELKDDLSNKHNHELFALNDQKGKLDRSLEEKSEEISSLQAKIFENSEYIKQLQIMLKKEKELKDDLSNKHNHELIALNDQKVKLDRSLEEKSEEISSLQAKIFENSEYIEQLQIMLKKEKELKDDLSNKHNHELIALNDQKVKLDRSLEEKSEEISSLQAHVHRDSDLIKQLKEEINDQKLKLDRSLEEKCEEISSLQAKIFENSEYIEQLQIMLKKEKELKDDLSNKHNLELFALNDQKVKLDRSLEEKSEEISSLQAKIFENSEYIELLQIMLKKEKELKDNLSNKHNQEKGDMQTKINDFVKLNDELHIENDCLKKSIEENNTVITNLEQLVKHELGQNKQLRDDNSNDMINLLNKCSKFENSQTNSEKQLSESKKENVFLLEQINVLKDDMEKCAKIICEKDVLISKLTSQKDALIATISQKLSEETTTKDKLKIELENKVAMVYELRQKLEDANSNFETMNMLRKENDELIEAVGQRETFAVGCQDKFQSHKYTDRITKEHQEIQQVDNNSSPFSDITHSSIESIKTISDLERIVQDKNRTITGLQSDITYLKSLYAESENKLLDVTTELDLVKENCHQLSVQLKKIVHQKNDEIIDLKKQVSKMSATENRASQIIKVSAKYQAIILKRIAEIKTNTILKELSNYTNSSDNDFRHSLKAGSITMEDLENFLETTDKHLKRCSDKQISLQRERDRLSEVNKINESEIINLKKFLTELSVSFKTFNSVRELYTQKLVKVLSLQRTVRREILNLDGTLTDATMCKLERGYAAIMQDLSECAMNLERWVERCIGRSISPERIKQAFTRETDRTSLATTSFQNAGLEVQLEEIENAFQKLLEDVMRAQKGDGVKDSQAITVMEVRAEYEDKLNRMKAKMKQLYQGEITKFKEQQKQEISSLEKELQETNNRLVENSRSYEEHIKRLTSELWHVGEKLLMKKDEADWLRKRSGSLMSLQHVHSSGISQPPDLPCRQSDTYSLKSLPTQNNEKRGGRGLHMSDEEGEVFDNRWLKDLNSTPRSKQSMGGKGGYGGEANKGVRLSELKWRNSLCPPHLKSTYPAETQFHAALDEEDIKSNATLGRSQRKEVGITAYKKPGPPTPSKQAGRLSATDSELRDAIRQDPESHASRKTGTPSRLRNLFRTNKTTSDSVEGTPRSKRLSIFRKK